MAATFHSIPYNKIIALLNGAGLVSGDLYYANDTQTLYLALTNTDGAVGIAQTGLILTGAIQLGFNGNVSSLAGEPVSGTPEVGQVLTFDGSKWTPATPSSSTPQTVNVSGAYTTSADDDVLFVALGSAAQITLTTDGIVQGKTYRVTLTTTSQAATVVSQNGELINGDPNAQLLGGDSLDFCWQGESWVLQ
jgi:hypothetical protein